jgi:hypothetical protein
MIRHGKITVTTSAQSLSNTTNLGANRPVRFLSVQPGSANSGRLFFGGPGVTTTDFGFAMEIPVTSIPSAPMIITDAIAAPGLLVGDLYVVGTNNDIVRVCWVPFE